jgi:Protein of unknown function (DUF1493)
VKETDIESELRELIVHELGALDYELRPTASLFHDLGVDGLAGEEFMETYARHFAVDMTGFHFNHHFGPEAAFNPFLYFYWRLFAPEHLRFIPITFAHLAHRARSHRWTTPSEPARATFEQPVSM